MRNLSMKKFGTPIGAAPGWASVKPGFSTVGVPSVLRPLVARSAFFLAWSLTMPSRSFVALVPGSVPGLWSLVTCECWLPAFEPGWLLPDCGWPDGVGDELPDGVGVLVPAGVGVEDGVGWTLAPGVAVGAGVTSWMPTTGSDTFGILIWSTGVPAGTSSVTVTCEPP